MPLFQPKVLQKHLVIPSAIPANHLQAIQDWQQEIASGKLKSLGEVSAHHLFIDIILERLLGYCTKGEQWTAYHECPIAGELDKIDVGLGSFTPQSRQIIAPLELKGLDTKNLDAVMPGRHKTPVQQVWEYATKVSKAKWALLSNYQELRLYAVGHGRQAYESWRFDQLHQPAEYSRFYTLLCAENLLGGATENLLLENEKVEKDITDRLYADYRNLRLALLTELRQSYPELAASTLLQYAQTIIDRILFIAFAEDKGLLPAKILEKAYTQQNPFNPLPIWENFKGLFRSIDKGNAALKIPAYNGGLFAKNKALDNLVISDALCDRFRGIADYDFASEVSVTVLGHIFEQSIADLEQLQEQLTNNVGLEDKTTKARATTGKRKQDGVVYTPNHITRFIVEQTLGSYIKSEFSRIAAPFQKKLKDGEWSWRSADAELKFWYAWQKRLKALRIIDPACGSGAFLVAAFDYLVIEYQKVNDTLHNLKGSYDLFDLTNTILNNNLYGVDLNAESVEITRLSLWLKTAEQGKALTNLDSSIRCGNSVVADSTFSKQAFIWQEQFPKVFADGGFDVVLGNPPYVRMELLKPIKPYLEKNYSVASDRADLYAYFFELGLKLLKPQGRLGYISSSTFFRTGSGENLRKHLLAHAKLESIIDFGDVQIFEGVTTYPAILIMEKSTESGDIRFCKIKNKLGNDLAQQFSEDNQIMPQNRLGAESWQFEDDTLATLRNKIISGKKILKEVYGSPYRGIVTGLNEAFVIDDKTYKIIVADNPQSNEQLKPFLEGKDLKQWRTESRGLWLILFPRGWTRSIMMQEGHTEINEASAWIWLQKKHPSICAWLTPFTEKAKKRGDKGEFWWELRACSYYEKFEGGKIAYVDIGATATFSIDKKSAYCANTAYFIANGDIFLLGLLNSKPIWFLITGLTNAIRGGFYRLFTQHLETLPIPEATAEEKERIGKMAEECQGVAEQRYQLEQRMCRRILSDLRPEGSEAKLSQKLQAWWELDFKVFHAEIKKCLKSEIPLKERDEWQELLQARQAEIKALSSKLATQEAALNEAVYALFKLTNAEIALLEKNLSQ